MPSPLRIAHVVGDNVDLIGASSLICARYVAIPGTIQAGSYAAGTDMNPRLSQTSTATKTSSALYRCCHECRYTYLALSLCKRMYVQQKKVDVVDASKDPRKLFSPLSCRAKPL